MVKTKFDVSADYRNLKRQFRPLKIEYDILKNHKIELYKYRENYIKSLKITEDMIRYLKFGDNGEQFTKFTEQKIDKLKKIIKKVSW